MSSLCKFCNHSVLNEEFLEFYKNERVHTTCLLNRLEHRIAPSYYIAQDALTGAKVASLAWIVTTLSIILYQRILLQEKEGIQKDMLGNCGIILASSYIFPKVYEEIRILTGGMNNGSYCGMLGSFVCIGTTTHLFSKSSNLFVAIQKLLPAFVIVPSIGSSVGGYLSRKWRSITEIIF